MIYMKNIMRWLYISFFFLHHQLLLCRSDSDLNEVASESAEKNFNDDKRDDETDKDLNGGDLALPLNKEESEKGQLIDEVNTQKELKGGLALQYEAEKKAGDTADLFGTGQHHYYPAKYPDFARRFVLQYPYKEKTQVDESDAEANLDRIVKKTQQEVFQAEDMKLIPVKASPEFVLNEAMESALHEANKPSPGRNVNERDILRTGEYWNSVWKEEVDPDSLLRSHKKVHLGVHNKVDDLPKLKSVRAEIMPGSKLYQLLSILKDYSPRLLYVINNKDS